MSWTRDIPNEVGWYWVTHYPTGVNAYAEVWLLDWSDLWCCVYQDNPRSAKWMRQNGCWFSPRIQPPRYPEVSSEGGT